MNDEHKSIIDAYTGAMVLIDMLYKKNLLNEKTYIKIQKEYGCQEQHIE